MYNLILTGFMGTGKTRVGQRVAQILRLPFVDLDHEIEGRAGKPVHRIFKEDGEDAFRRMESELLKEACNGAERVVATGGGAMVDLKNRKLMLRSGVVICLEALPGTIYRRLDSQLNNPSEEVRPLLAGTDPLKRIKELKESRQPLYAQAHWTLQTDYLTEEQVAQEVVRAWQLLRGKISPEVSLAGPGDGLGAGNSELAAIVTHSSGSYPILVGSGLLDGLGERLLAMGLKGPAYIVSDDRVFPTYGRQAQLSLHRSQIEAHCFIVPPGEQSKSLELAEAIYQWLVERRAERGHVIVAVGGGVVGDLAGFVASTFLRGIPFVQVPTSMAAMVDASIGGKVAVNLKEGKNLVGAFYHPAMVLADVNALETLGRRELAEGWAEAVKHGLILDAELFQTFEEHADDLMALDNNLTVEVVRRSMAIKAQIVSEDERETLGNRTLLNYGHTIGHALEAATEYGRFLHGEAVSVGMMGAAHISHAMGLIGEEVVERQRRLLEQFDLPTGAPGVDLEGVVKAMSLDKKMQEGSISWVLLEDIGKAAVHRHVPNSLVQETLANLLH